MYNYRQRQQCGDSQRGWGLRDGVGEMGVERDFAWGDRCTMRCAGDVLLTCTLETYMDCESMSPQ